MQSRSTHPWLRSWLRSALACAVLAAPAVAVADDAEVARRLSAYEGETRELASNLPANPNEHNAASTGHRLTQAEVAFGLGNYDEAALILFDLLGHTNAGDSEAVSYYLGESLYQKGDRGAARQYFQQVVAANNASGRYYPLSLERLVEIAIVQKDDAGAQQALGAIDRVQNQTALVPYIHGKYAYAQGRFDEALAAFARVPKGGDWELQSLYFTGTAQVAQKDLAKATDSFVDLISRKPRTSNDRRVIELGQIALGRLYYERDEPSKSIDSYLLVDRHSDLFPDALYEVAWVYVKGKQFDKALRALELLAKSDPQSTRAPTVRILEGNLRIRKAQMIRAAQVDGTGNSADDPGVEYDKAAKTFTDTHDLYMPSFTALEGMVDAKVDPALYLAQLANRNDYVFQTAAPLPDAAAQMLRDEPEVQRVVASEVDLGTVTADLAEVRSTIARLEGVIAATDKSNLYPALSARRSHISSIQDDLLKVRDELADRQLALINPSAELSQLTASRKQLSQQYTSMPNAAKAAQASLSAALGDYDKIEGTLGETDGAIDSAHAMAVALRTYASDQRNVGGNGIPQSLQASTLNDLDAIARDAQAIEDEIADARREEQLGRDLVGVGDEGLSAARTLRKQVTAAQSAEHRVLAGFASGSRDAGQSQQLAALGDRAARIADQLDQVDGQIETSIATGIAQAKGLLAQYEQELAAIQSELAADEADAHDTGGAILGASLASVKDKFYDIIVRTDVGNVDVAWSAKEDTDDDLKRLRVARARDLKQLHDEFKDILDDGLPKPSEQPKKSAIDLPPPDANGNDQRVSPGSKTGSGAAPSSVRPDQPKPATPPKGGKGASK